MQFSQLLQSYRAAAGLSQEELAERAGLSRRGISDLERGERRAPHAATVRRLAEALGVAPNDRAALFTAARTPRVKEVSAGLAALVHPRAEFPPPVSIGPALHNLPNQLSSFVGREEAIAELHRLLVNARLLTLTGPGGIGKTRLALAVAAVALPDYAGGVRLAELASLSDPLLVAPTLAAVFGVRESGNRLIEQLCAIVSSGPALLLLLDNCEHVVDACAELVERLLRVAPDLQIIATSRQPLGSEGEVVWRVPGLSIDEPAQSGVETEAVRLFVERATAVAPGFRLTEQRGAIVDLCRQVDGIPLAIELAAARVKVLTPDQIVARMGDRFRLLVSAGRTGLPRQQTLRAAVDWSYDLLTLSEQTLFNRLSLFAGGCTLEAAEAVCADPEESPQIAPENVLDLIGRLVDQSLLEAESTDGTIRFRMLETLRQYAAERLRETDQQSRLRNRHQDWCLTIVEPPFSVWAGVRGNKEAPWFARVDREHENIRATLAWALQNPSDAEPALRLAGNMSFFWWHRGHVGEGRAWVERALDLDARVGTNVSVAVMRARQRALRGAGILARLQSDYAAAESMFSASLALARELDDPELIADGLCWLGFNALYRGDHTLARALAQESLASYRQLTDPERAKQAQIHGPLSLLANVAFAIGDHVEAKVLFEERLRYARDASDPRGIASSLLSLGVLASQKGEHIHANQLLDASREGYAKMADRTGVAWASRHAAGVARARGDIAQASQLFRESLTMYRELGALWGIAECLEGLAAVAADADQCEHAAQLFGSAAALREAGGVRLAPWAIAKQELELGALRGSLGPDRFEAAWQMGRERLVSKAIEVALI